MRETRALALAGITIWIGAQVDVGIFAPVIVPAAANDEKACRLMTTIDQVMAVAYTGRPGGTVAGVQDNFTVVFNQHQFTRYYIHELILSRMPMTLARPDTRFQGYDVDTELCESGNS